MMNYFGDKGLDLFGYLQRTIIQDFSINGQNYISSVQDMDGSWHTSEEWIAQVAKQYFKKLFTTANPTDMGCVLDAVDICITSDINTALLQRYTSDKV